MEFRVSPINYSTRYTAPGWLNEAVMIRHTYVNPVLLLGTLLCLSVCANSDSQSEQTQTTKHVCIVGAGIAGASAAHFLSLSQHVPRITVFEKSDKIGGRIQSLELQHPDLANVEAGASIISNANILMRHFATYLNLKEKPKSKSNRTKFSLWNGTHVIMSTSDTSYISIVRLLVRYGMSPIRSKWITKRLLKLFDNIYPHNITNYDCTGYPTVQSLFAQTRLFNLTQIHLSDALANQLSTHFSKEIVSAITRVNYGQNFAEMNALAGNIAMAGSGSQLWGVKGGNVLIPTGLLERSSALVNLQTRVTKIMRQDGGGYILNLQNQESALHQSHCHAVIITTPIELDNIDLPNDVATKMHVERQYQKTVATFIEGTINAKFGERVGSVLTTEDVDVGFTSIGYIKQITQNGNTRAFWKVFSPEEMNDTTIGNLFEHGWIIRKIIPWMAYPKFRVPESFAPFDVDPVGKAVFYTSPIESAGSAMEMSAIAGANAAALVRTRLHLGVHPTPSKSEDDYMSSTKTDL